ncbi:lysine methyltransferase 5Ab [Salminus brasiliensis]|uniref:lysine methyltransferase 5Ab n=1 Tax=Salminus brasiliensis TaxID=930266 RepID=UPI003B832200
MGGPIETAKGKKNPTVELHRNEVQGEAKENKHETKKTRQVQSVGHTFASPESPHSPLRNTPLFPINEENLLTRKQGDSTKHRELRLKAEFHSNQKSNGARISSLVPKEKTVPPHEDDQTIGAALPNKSTHVKVKVNKTTQKKLESKTSQHSRKVTDYYPIRRSSRKSKAELKSEEQRQIDDLITNNVEDGLKVKYIEGKGRGVFADREFHKGQFVVEYHGDLLQIADAKKREAQYAQDPSKGCYMYYFSYLSNNYCVDATKETGRLGRLINHSKNGNCQTRLHDLNGVPHLILVASRDIKAEEELLYDYGDRSKEAIAAHPWLKH